MHMPLIVVLGATGAGKSKLALDIGQRLDAEIINADAMQMYKGLDIVTNKVTADELKICPHHLIGFLSPRQQFTISDFHQHALELINDMHRRNKVPILVGGTNYYVESVLWETLIKIKDDKSTASDMISSVDEIRKKLYQMSISELHKKLRSVDPQMAATVHPHDKRKVIRGLEVYYQTGKPMSEHYAGQRMKSGGSNIGGPLRFPHSCVLWVKCDPDILCRRIRKRVDQMVSRGLLKELADFHADFNKERFEENLEREYEHGIFQSIGFKEFHNYLTCDDETKKHKFLEEGIERMKTSTWQYAKYQQKWIRKRIVNRSCSVPVYGLNASDPSKWEELVLNPALKVVQSFYETCPEIAEKLRDPNFEKTPVLTPIPTELRLATNDDRSLKECEICGGKLIAAPHWEAHLKSKKHKKIYGLLKKQQRETVKILSERQRQLSQSPTEEYDFNENDLKLFNEDNSA